MAYNLLGQQGNKGDRNPDPNLTAEQATYLYDTPPGSGDNKGLTNAGKPVDKKDVEQKLEDVSEPIRFTDGPDEDRTQTSTTTNNVSDAQTLLKNAGFDPGVIDGLNGPNTKAAAEAYINASRGQDELNKRRKEVGFIIGVETPTTSKTTTKSTIILFDKNGNPIKFLRTEPWQNYVDSGQLFLEKPNQETQDDFMNILNSIEFGESMPADATNRDVDLINKELGITNTALGSAISRGWERAMRGDMGANEYLELVDNVNEAIEQYEDTDNSTAERVGAFLRKGAMGLGFTARGVGSILEETLGGLFNSGTDLIRPEQGGIGDAFFDALMGVEQGTNAYSTWVTEKKPGWRYDSATNSFYDVATGNPITGEEVVTSISESEEDTQEPNNEGSGVSKTGNGEVVVPKVEVTEEEYPEGFPKRVYRKDSEFGEQVFNQQALDDALANGYSLENTGIFVYQAPGTGTAFGELDQVDSIDTTEVGPGQVVNSTLNTFNNIPQNAILIEAAGQLFLGYEVPGAYGQMYSGEPMFMLYEVLDNDVYEAGILTQGASPQVNVSLGSLDDLNQYGIVVGGTDELTDNVEHPFIRFVENFEAGKRVNPWLNDTEINPISGVSYQQEAIEFLAEQALEQWSPEETQLKYEGTDWYRKSTTTQKQWLTTLLTQPEQATQDILDKQLSVRIAMEANGIASPPDALVSWFADKAVSGTWTQLYTDNQIALLADPYKPGARDTGMVNFIEGVGVGTLDRLSVGEKTVTDLYRRYLGPSLGNASADEIAEKAGLLRNDPDAEEQLKSYLEQQRLAMFGKYTNPTLTYNDIVQPYKNLVNQVWGQEVDETQDWFIKMVQDNDIEQAYTTLREKGIAQGIGRVQDQALNDLQSSIGQGQVAPQLGANG